MGGGAPGAPPTGVPSTSAPRVSRDRGACTPRLRRRSPARARGALRDEAVAGLWCRARTSARCQVAIPVAIGVGRERKSLRCRGFSRQASGLLDRCRARCVLPAALVRQRFSRSAWRARRRPQGSVSDGANAWVRVPENPLGGPLEGAPHTVPPAPGITHSSPLDAERCEMLDPTQVPSPKKSSGALS